MNIDDFDGIVFLAVSNNTSCGMICSYILIV